MSQENFYTLLGIAPDIEDGHEDIKSSFRKLAKQHHPDLESGNEELFKKINLAYETLSDPQKRRMYDMQTGYNPKVPKNNFGSSNGFNPFEGFGGFGFNQSNFGNFEDMFSNIFGNFSRRKVLNVPYSLNFHQIFFGHTVEIPVKIKDISLTEKIIIEPRKLRTHQKEIRVNEHETIILSFNPQIINSPEFICKDANDVELDNNLNCVLTFKIPFINALKGGVIKKKIFEQTIDLHIPKPCPYEHTIEKHSLSIVSSSRMFIKFIYDLPNISKEKIDKIEKLIN